MQQTETDPMISILEVVSLENSLEKEVPCEFGHDDPPPRADWKVVHDDCQFLLCEEHRQAGMSTLILAILLGENIECKICGKELNPKNVKYYPL